MKKILAILLTLLLVMQIVPTVAMAAEPNYASLIDEGGLELYDNSDVVSIDLNGNTDLYYLVIMGAKNLQSINLSGCTNLFMLVIIDAPELTSVDLSGCTGLNAAQGVKIIGAASLATVNVTGCSDLPLLYLGFCPEIATLTGLSDCTGLTDLRIYGSAETKLGALDLSACADISVIKLAHDIQVTLPQGKETTDDSADSAKVLYHKMYATTGTAADSAKSVMAIKTGDSTASYDLKSLIGAVDYSAVPDSLEYLNGAGTVNGEPYCAIPVEKGSNGCVSFSTDSDYLEWCIKKSAYVEDHIVSVSYMEDNTGTEISVSENASKENVTNFVANPGKTIDLDDPNVVLVPAGEIKDRAALSVDEVNAVEEQLPEEAQAEMWLDLNILVVDTDNGNEELGKVTQVSGKVQFSIDLPQDVLNAINRSRYVYVARYHDEVVDFLNVAIEEGKAVFETDRFSTYALVTSDVKLIDDNSFSFASLIGLYWTAKWIGEKVCEVSATPYFAPIVKLFVPVSIVTVLRHVLRVLATMK